MQINGNILPCLSSDSFFKSNLPFFIESRPHKYGDILNMHIHEFIEIGYVASGHGFHITPNNVVNINKGDVFIIKKGVPHQIAVPVGGTEPLCLYNCMFSPALFAGYKELLSRKLYNDIFMDIVENTGEIQSCELIFTDNKNYTVGDCLNRLLCEYNTRPHGYDEVIPLLMLELLIELNRLYTHKTLEKNSSYKYNIVQLAINYISENYSRKITLSEIATHSFLSPSQFSRIFKLAVGKTVSDYVQEEKIKSLQKYVSQGLSICEAAEKCGYKNYSTFFRAYKKMTGLSPRMLLDDNTKVK